MKNCSLQLIAPEKAINKLLLMAFFYDLPTKPAPLIHIGKTILVFSKVESSQSSKFIT